MAKKISQSEIKPTKKESAPIPYWQQRRDLKLKAPHGKQEVKAEEKKSKKELSIFFASQALAAPSKCENCQRSLQSTIKFHPRAHIAHIVPKTKKGGCPSVATHPKNRAFLCLDCHTCYDKAVAERDNYIIDQMAVVEVLRERYKEFQAQIPAEERKNIPEYLLIENDGKQGKRAAGNKKNK